MANPPLIVIGASTGGLEALTALATALPGDLPAAVCMVMHIDSHPSDLPRILARESRLPVKYAEHGEPMLAGHIYVAPPDRHMLVKGDALQVLQGPKEHFTRPAIDPLFRSASENGPAVIGVILTGNLNDGTPGLQRIKQRGGLVIVQNPADAVAPGMPASARAHVDVDYCVPLASMPVLLVELAWRLQDTLGRPGPPDKLPLAPSFGPVSTQRDADNRSPFMCPSCKGSLAAAPDTHPLQYSCYTGHRFTLESLAHAQSVSTDGALWSAYRALCEKQMLLVLLADQARAGAAPEKAMQWEAEAETVCQYAAALAQLMEHVPATISDQATVSKHWDPRSD